MQIRTGLIQSKLLYGGRKRGLNSYLICEKGYLCCNIMPVVHMPTCYTGTINSCLNADSSLFNLWTSCYYGHILLLWTGVEVVARV